MELTGVPGIVHRSRNPCSFFAGLNASVYVPLSFERDRRAKRDVVRVVSCRVVSCRVVSSCAMQLTFFP